MCAVERIEENASDVSRCLFNLYDNANINSPGSLSVLITSTKTNH